VSALQPVVTLSHVGLRYKKKIALEDISFEAYQGEMLGLIGPDGVGKSSLLALIAGARQIQTGKIEVLGGDMGLSAHRQNICPRIAYMPQGLGKNLYRSLSIEENLQFFARLFGHNAAERRQRIDQLTQITGLYEFLDRPVGKLSGGMKQKLGLCCALIHDPDLLILDEPTTGVDPLARVQFWKMITHIRQERPQMTILVATAYMDEAQRYDRLIAMDDGKILAMGSPADLLHQTQQENLEHAFVAMLPEQKKRRHTELLIPPLAQGVDHPVAIQAENLTMRFDQFIAVDHVSFQIRRGEIFGFIGSNGCGKTTTMKMLTGLLPASEGQAWIFGHPLDATDLAIRKRVGYMSQSFSLYGELTVRQNLVLHAQLFHVPKHQLTERVQKMIERFDLVEVVEDIADKLPLGIRQRLSLAVAMVHQPELLILDEPTSGVDPIARDEFWRYMIEIARQDQVTIFISTHFMNEAVRCDRISLMHAGRVLVTDEPAKIIADRNAKDLEEAFIDYLIEADETLAKQTHKSSLTPSTSLADQDDFFETRIISQIPQMGTLGQRLKQSLIRAYSFLWRETLELRRDPFRGAMALLGSIILMFVMGYGISMDVEDLRYAVLDRDQTTLTQNYIMNLSGSRYFKEERPITDYDDLDRRMRSGQIALAIEIPPNFTRDLMRGNPKSIGVWIDGAMPQRAETIQGYVQGIHQHWLTTQLREQAGLELTPMTGVESRYRYNPDVRSLPAMVPAVIPLLLLMLPAMLTALAVVREKELGSIINFYVTPTSRIEFLIGKQVPYIVLAMFNFLLMTFFAVFVFGVPMTGHFFVLFWATFFFVLCSTAMGLLASTITRSQIAAIFFTMIGTMLPAVEFAGLINPVSSLDGVGRMIGQIYPASHMLVISRGVFSKGLDFFDLYEAFIPMILAVPIIMLCAVFLLKKQEA